jgi:plastocyanin
VTAAPATVASPATAAVIRTIRLDGFLFDGRPNAKVSARVGDRLRFVWAADNETPHALSTARVPLGVARTVDTGLVATQHAPVSYRLARKGVYRFYCQAHRVLGMVVTVTVRPAHRRPS